MDLKEDQSCEMKLTALVGSQSSSQQGALLVLSCAFWLVGRGLAH